MGAGVHRWSLIAISRQAEPTPIKATLLIMPRAPAKGQHLRLWLSIKGGVCCRFRGLPRPVIAWHRTHFCNAVLQKSDFCRDFVTPARRRGVS